jgi:hypothetical protein
VQVDAGHWLTRPWGHDAPVRNGARLLGQYSRVRH